MVVEEETGAYHPCGPQVRFVRQHEFQRPDDVRGDLEQRFALGERLGDEAEFEILQVAKPAVDELGRSRRGPRGEIALLDQQHLQAAPGGIARDAAGRGLKVLLVEQSDLASGTSSASTKLIHGGLRYLEYFEFRLVAEALAERETLLKIAPHIIWPLEFVLPHESHLRPAWMIRAGLFLYDHLGHRMLGFGSKSSLPMSKGVRLADNGYGAGLKPEFKRGFVYYDCWVDDARLMVLNARSAAAHGATIQTHTRLVSARRARSSFPRRCAWGRAATSSCRASTRSATRSSCRTRTGA